jgi:hypothetical protein
VFEDALADYKRAFCKVCDAFGHDPDKIMQELTAEKLAEITTSVSMASTRGQYGAYIGYLFAGEQGSQAQPSAQASPIQSWKTFMHPKSHKRLGEYDEANFLKLAEWAYHPPQPLSETAVEAKALQANVRMGTVEKKIARSVFLSLFAKEAGYSTEFDENDLEAVCGEQFGKASANLEIGDWESMLGQFPEIIADCKTEHDSSFGDVPF